MAKGLIGGGTDYSHQSFKDLLTDLEAERKRTIEFRDAIQANIDKLEANGYWTTNVPNIFKGVIARSLTHFTTSIEEFEDILKGIKIEVELHHINRLKKISEVADEINVQIGKIWHQDYHNQDYGNKDFRFVEIIYGDTRGMAVNLLDTSNIASRLKDFIGKKDIKMKNNNPWTSGSFYLIVSIVVISGLAVLSNIVHWSLFPIILIGGILLITTIGILQLRNDDKITDRSFTSLVKETYKRLPLLKQNKKEKN